MPETSRPAHYREHIRYFNPSGPDAVGRDHLATCLAEPRVQRVIEPLLADSFPANSGLGHADDVFYVRDLGLIAERTATRVANPIYKELIVRSLPGREITLLLA